MAAAALSRADDKSSMLKASALLAPALHGNPAPKSAKPPPPKPSTPNAKLSAKPSVPKPASSASELHTKGAADLSAAFKPAAVVVVECVCLSVMAGLGC